jgi:outer membrane protein OmpA-like peptidoglycan-associated protein
MKRSYKLFAFLFVGYTFGLKAQTTTPEQTLNATPQVTTPAAVEQTIAPAAIIDQSLTPAAPEEQLTTPAVPESTITPPPVAAPAVTEPTTVAALPESTVATPPVAAPAITEQTTAPSPAVSDQTVSPAAVPPAESQPVSPPPPADIAAPVVASAAPADDNTSVILSKSQGKNIRKANMLYNSQAYSEAIPYYEKALEVDRTNKMILAHLGDCYRLTNNVSGQITCYGSLVNMGSAEPIQELYYGEALVENGEPEKAKPYFEKFSLDQRGKDLASSLSKTNSYKRNADAYSLSEVPYNSPQSDFSPVKFRDMIVFASTRAKTVWVKKQQAWTNGNYLGLYVAPNSSNGLNKPALFMGDLDSRFNDGPICFSKDYNTIYLTRNNSKKEERAKDGTYKLKLLEAMLDENGFSMVRLFPFNNNDYNFAHPSISPDGYTLYFASDMPGGKGGMDIYRTKKDSTGVWGPPENLGDLVNTAGTEVFPFIAESGLLYFSSNGHDGLGGLDIYEAKLNGGKVTKIYNMGEPVNSKDDDFGIYLMEDNKTGYISSNRKAGGMDDDIYMLQILRDVKRGKEALIVVKDKENTQPLDSAKLVINGDTVMTNDKGEYTLSLEDEKEYKIQTLVPDYFSKEDTISTKNSTEDSFVKEIAMEKDPKLFLRALITDAKTNELLEGVNIKLTDIAASAEVDNYVTTASGDYFKFLYGKHIGDKLTYLMRIEKPGYLERTLIFTHIIDKPGEINMNQSLNLTLGKVEVGMDLGKMIDLKPIYFDLGKSAIRKDAAEELDKIVQVMNEYPNMFIELGSHTDCRSSAESNMKLSTARAKSSAEYIVKKGINRMRITSRGYGESRLLNNCACEGKVQSNCSEEEHEKNRRTEFVITRLK